MHAPKECNGVCSKNVNNALECCEGICMDNYNSGSVGVGPPGTPGCKSNVNPFTGDNLGKYSR